MKIEEKRRYDRQFLLKDWDQQKISRGRVFIAGMGAIGCPSAINLALMGMGTIIICDYDTIEISNLSRQLLFLEDDINQFKSKVAERKLKELNPNINVISYNKKIEELDPEIFDTVNILIDGLDNFEARRYLNSIAIDKKKPLIHAGTYGWYGNVQVVIPFKTACLQCQPLIPEKRLSKPCTPPGKIRKKEIIEEKEHFPSINTVSMILSSIQCQEALKILLGIGKIMEDFLFYDSLSQSFTYMPLKKNKDCIICGEKRLKSNLFAVEKGETINDVKKRLIVTFNLDNEIKLMLKGKILNDNAIIEDNEVKNDDFLFIYSKNMPRPLKIQLKFS
ncbi:MAG: hypothetical protein EAX96_11640 [Candidatus Lokiarchaeota archaeon]|nr:hypothetical protein [Candidatus Lokiarchaeota archaeon]